MLRAARSCLLLFLIGSSFLAHVLANDSESSADEQNKEDQPVRQKDERQVREEVHDEYLSMLRKFKEDLLRNITIQWRTHQLRSKAIRDNTPGGILRTRNNNMDDPNNRFFQNSDNGNKLSGGQCDRYISHDLLNQQNSFTHSHPNDERNGLSNGLIQGQSFTSQHSQMDPRYDSGYSQFIRQNGDLRYNPAVYRDISTGHQHDGRIQISDSTHRSPDVSTVQQDRLGFNSQCARQIPVSSISQVRHYHHHIVTIVGNPPNQQDKQQQFQPAHTPVNPNIQEPVQSSNPPRSFFVQEIVQPSNSPCNSPPIQQRFQPVNQPSNRPIQTPVQSSKQLNNPCTEQRVQPTSPPTNPPVEPLRFGTCVPANPTFLLVPTAGTEQLTATPNCNVPRQPNQSFNIPQREGCLVNQQKNFETNGEKRAVDPISRQGWNTPQQNCNPYVEQPRKHSVYC